MAAVETHELVVRGEQSIHCVGCENRLEGLLARMPGVLTTRADHTSQKISVRLDAGKTDLETVRNRLVKTRYELPQAA